MNRLTIKGIEQNNNAPSAGAAARKPPDGWRYEYDKPRRTIIMVPDGCAQPAMTATPQQEARDNRITTDELAKIFGPTMPWEAFELLHNTDSGLTVDQVREKLHRLAAAESPSPTGDSEAGRLSAADADLLNRSADEMAAICAPQPTGHPIQSLPVTSSCGAAQNDVTQLVERLRNHVQARGGFAKDENGNPVCPNGAWQMMLEAADALESANSRLARLEQFAAKVGRLVSDCENDFHRCERCDHQDDEATKTSNLWLILKDDVAALSTEAGLRREFLARAEAAELHVQTLARATQFMSWKDC